MSNQCANCDTIFQSPYCPACGQKAGTGRLHLHSLVHEFWHGFTHTDKGVIKLWVDLLQRPAVAYQNYFSGKRKSYFSPVVFFLVSFGLYIYFDHVVFDYQDYIVQKATGHLYNNEIGRFQQEHAKYIALTLLPVQALITYAAFYKRYNLAECITFWLFCVGFINTIIILITPLRLLLINQKELVDRGISILIILIYLWHLFAVFGLRLISIAKSALILLVILVVNVYVTFYFLATLTSPFYPNLIDSVKIAIGYSAPMYRNGTWRME